MNLCEWAFPPHLPTPVSSSATPSLSISSLGCPFSFHPQVYLLGATHYSPDTLGIQSWNYRQGPLGAHLLLRDADTSQVITLISTRYGAVTTECLGTCCRLAVCDLRKQNSNSIRPYWYVSHINLLYLHSEPTKQVVSLSLSPSGEIYSHWEVSLPELTLPVRAMLLLLVEQQTCLQPGEFQNVPQSPENKTGGTRLKPSRWDLV